MYSRTFVWLAASWWQRHTGSHYRSSPSNYRTAGDVKAVLSARRGEVLIAIAAAGEVACSANTWILVANSRLFPIRKRAASQENFAHYRFLGSLSVTGSGSHQWNILPHHSGPGRNYLPTTPQPLRLIELPRWWMVYLPLIGLFDENLPWTNGSTLQNQHFLPIM